MHSEKLPCETGLGASVLSRKAATIAWMPSYHVHTHPQIFKPRTRTCACTAHGIPNDRENSKAKGACIMRRRALILHGGCTSVPYTIAPIPASIMSTSSKCCHNGRFGKSWRAKMGGTTKARTLPPNAPISDTNKPKEGKPTAPPNVSRERSSRIALRLSGSCGSASLVAD